MQSPGLVVSQVPKTVTQQDQVLSGQRNMMQDEEEAQNP